MVSVLTIDDGDKTRAGKTRMYQLLAQGKGATTANKKLQDLKRLNDPKELQGYDIILTDLDGSSVSDNQEFLRLLETAVQSGSKPVVRMFSGSFNGVSSDLPMTLLPSSLQGIVTTHAD